MTTIKNKRSTIILLISVLLVWGIIAFKVITDLSSSNKHRVTPIKTIQPVSDGSVREQYKLSPIIRDPFLDIYIDTVTDIEEYIIPSQPKADITPQYTLPVFVGTLENKNSVRAILKIKNEYFFLAKGEECEYFSVINIEDSIVKIKLQGEIFEIDINNR